MKMQLDGKINGEGPRNDEKSRKSEAGGPDIEENWDRGCLQEWKTRS